MTWDEAKVAAATGQRVRMAASDEWFSRSALGAWSIQIPGEQPKFVPAEKFGAKEFRDRTWTTEPIAEGDVCSRPGATRPEFDAPAVHVRASWMAGTLTMTGVLGAGSEGKYALFFYVDGVLMGTGLATEAGEFTKTFAVPWKPVINAVFLVQSVLPLAPWSDEKGKTLTLTPLVCLMMPVGDVVVEITGEQFARYVAGGTWTMDVDESFSEVHAGGSSIGGGGGSGSNGGSGCDATVTASTASTVVVLPGGSTPSFSNAYMLDVSFGYAGGKYYMAVSISGLFKTGSSGTGYGTASATVDGHSIPMVSAWGPSWAGYTGYVNATVVTCSATFTP